MPTLFTLITTFSDAELRTLPGGTLPVLHQRGQAEAQRRKSGSSAVLISLAMSDQVAPPFGGAAIVSKWQLRALTEAPTDE
ncbi:hypothetical protein EKD04_009550 [Chloroflexales bacterium ZM16-3]|nr:hypothetical protein [Chloroflexales bacterium ZM16-3]